jgi:molybdopterin converting factor small subunit
MEIKVNFLGIYRDFAGQGKGMYTLPNGTTVGDLVDILASVHPKLDEARGQMRVMVNGSLATLDQALTATDEVFVMGPIRGG